MVTFEASPLALAYADETGIEWPILIDQTRLLYRAYGMFAGGFWDIWGPSTWWAYVKELAKGRLPRASRSDLRQLGGDVLIDPEGFVRFHYVGRGPADRPSVDTLLRARMNAVEGEGE